MKKWHLVRGGVAADALEEKVAALATTETKGLSADERRRKFVSKRAAKKSAAAKSESA
jgi:hypothetical protein